MSTCLERHGRQVRRRRDQSKPVDRPTPQEKETINESDDERVLKDFDLDYAFGPAYGISRLERWERAQSQGLSPPQTVRDLINQHLKDPSYTESLWSRKV